MKHDQLVFAATLCRHAASQGLAPGSSGNISIKNAGEIGWISKTGCHFSFMGPEDFLPNISTNDEWRSKEWRFHEHILEHYGRGCVLHLHPRHTTALSTRDPRFVSESYCVPWVKQYERLFFDAPWRDRVPLIYWSPPGSKELADAIGRHFTTGEKPATIAVMQDHGVVAYGETIYEALHKIQTLEEVAFLAWSRGRIL